jgi:hypothetical protein
MTRFGFSAALLLAAAPALAQQATPGATAPAGAAEIQQAAMAFGQCVETGAKALAATVTPEAGAATVMTGCTAQRAALERAAETLIAGPAVPQDKKAAARTQLRSELAMAPTKIADGIRKMRAASAAAPAATPAKPQK